MSESIGSIREQAGVGTALTPDKIAGLIADDLVSVERMFRENLASPVEIVEEIGDFVAASGRDGDRLINAAEERIGRRARPVRRSRPGAR